MTTKLILLRHGESVWNKENRFTGWTDVDLSDKGQEEAKEAGRLIKAAGLEFNFAFSSVLKRAIRTLWHVLDQNDRMWVPVQNSWRLNERHYGALQGLNKSETAEKYGEQQVLVWRRSFDTPPPLLAKDDPRHPCNEPRYQGESDLPGGEALSHTIQRMLPYWFDRIVPTIQSGKKVIIAAHGNSLRALVKHLDQMSNEQIMELNIPTGIPLIYELSSDLKPLKKYYLGDQEKLAAAQAKVANEGKKK